MNNKNVIVYGYMMLLVLLFTVISPNKSLTWS